MKMIAAFLLGLAATTAGAEPQGLRVPGGNPGPSAYAISGMEVQPPAKRTDGQATVKINLAPTRPGLQLVETEMKLLYADRGMGGSGKFRRDAPQPRDLPKGTTRYIAFPETARLGCIDPLQPRQLVVITYSEGGRRNSEAHLVPFDWFDQFPTLDGRCHIPR